VFFDRTDLEGGDDYHGRSAIASGTPIDSSFHHPRFGTRESYTLTEPGIAREKWAHPKVR
jgi:hypothetical protein